jgi:hypothetical protein
MGPRARDSTLSGEWRLVRDFLPFKPKGAAFISTFPVFEAVALTI